MQSGTSMRTLEEPCFNCMIIVFMFDYNLTISITIIFGINCTMMVNDNEIDDSSICCIFLETFFQFFNLQPTKVSDQDIYRNSIMRNTVIQNIEFI